MWDAHWPVTWLGSSVDIGPHFWVNDGLMTLFFLLVGLELKREIKIGELSSPKLVALPAIAALGGMIVPAALYLSIVGRGPGAQAWGIPIATDIAFALGILSLIRAPAAVKAFLVALAIVDDLGAILVIAFAYSRNLDMPALIVAAGVFAVALILGARGLRSKWVYLLIGVALWLGLWFGGVHPTLAGVLLAAAVPLGANDESGPLVEMERAVHPWATYVAMPVFAFANAGIEFGPGLQSAAASPISWGIAAGLIVGKPAGIALFSWLAVRFRMAELPREMGWGGIVGVGLLGGVGFTMSLFISQLGLHEQGRREAAKTAILIASLIAGCAGALWFKLVARRAR